MFEEVGKYVGSKVLTAVLALGVIAATIWFWRHPDDLGAIWSVIKWALVWLGLVVITPWVAFPATAWIIRRDSNTASAILILALLAVDAFYTFHLAGWHVSGVLTWMVLILGLLCAGVYNFMVCEFQAERLQDNL